MTQSMVLVKGLIMDRNTGNKVATFRMIPVNKECPYIEAVFDPKGKALGIVGQFKKNTYSMVPKLDADGNIEYKKDKKLKEGEIPIKQERRLEESWNEYELLTLDEIAAFVNMFAINHKEFDYAAFFKKEDEETEDSKTATSTEGKEAVPFTATVTKNEAPTLVN